MYEERKARQGVRGAKRCKYHSNSPLWSLTPLLRHLHPYFCVSLRSSQDLNVTLGCDFVEALRFVEEDKRDISLYLIDR